MNTESINELRKLTLLLLEEISSVNSKLDNYITTATSKNASHIDYLSMVVDVEIPSEDSTNQEIKEDVEVEQELSESI